MITLDKVTADSIFVVEEYDRINEFIKKERILNVQDFIDKFNEHPKIKSIELYKALDKIKSTVDKYNRKGVEPDLEPFTTYSDETLNVADEMNSVEVLPIHNPTRAYDNITVSRANRFSIAEIKQRADLVYPDGDNVLKSSILGFGPKKYAMLREAIEIFTKQIEANGKLTEDRENNLLYQDYNYKREIVESKYAEIINYFLYYAKDFVWGELTDEQKRLYLSSTINRKAIDKLIRERVIDYITNYITFNDAQFFLVDNYSALKKFTKR